jgi:pre-mRNA-splicing factor ATP-dependent RNA helicase DHX38/PRP16
MPRFSHFATSKTITEQREYLPIFQCREHLLQIIRDNPVIVVVGETGSGMHTKTLAYHRSIDRSIQLTGVRL